jgi:hypothetical protein
MSKHSEAEKRAAIDRMARRFADESRRQGRPRSHDSVMDLAREIARKHDRKQR